MSPSYGIVDTSTSVEDVEESAFLPANESSPAADVTGVTADQSAAATDAPEVVDPHKVIPIPYPTAPSATGAYTASPSPPMRQDLISLGSTIKLLVWNMPHHGDPAFMREWNRLWATVVRGIRWSRSPV